METIYDAVDRRYASEFHVAKMVAGMDGTAITGPDGVRHATQLYTFVRVRPVRVTFSYYVKVLVGTVALMGHADAEVTVDRVTQPEQVLLTANGEWRMANGEWRMANGEWHHIVSRDGTEFAAHMRFSNNSIRFYAKAGARMLFALPALVPGFVHLPSTAGRIPTLDHW